jgi:hypothetical protein
MTLDEAKKEAARLRATLDPRDPEEGHTRARITQLEDLVRDVEQRDRVAAAATMDVRGLSKRMKELQDADKTLTPFQRAEFRGRHEAESDAIGRRIAQLNAGAASPAVDPLATRRAEARATYLSLQATNPIAASAFAARVGDAVLFDDPEREPAA